ncbi:MAG: hypothetical protein UT48_C0039G0005 [Parcubacteria group bacterium GW2011_GWE2_39_37]|uniref:Lipoprotein n=1 Tax=Candidatus Falkowbacteria bacterium GW2011_GWF2_39_8 TaxID=1618642 RepID=A0A0G0PVG6_9BACT|nr:MAG: hypothetical protein UT48_C0039G0005 [Parcubacteria group bacterium GW2011_GWE2_39_37]KKR32144.1 MAG: hypothetical protein UT64_C0041G0008 [Candidatus Falkowbacteria bacterium GW2011_GWF2_39_8]
MKKIIGFVTLLFILSGCSNNFTKTDAQPRNVITSKSQETNLFVADTVNKDTTINSTTSISMKNNLNIFTSRNNKLSFSYKNDWVCKEVIYSKRVDCYPEIRKSEEFIIGMDQPTVYFPEITITINNCETNNIPKKDPQMTSLYSIKNYNGCKVLVLGEDEKSDTEVELNSIIIN